VAGGSWLDRSVSPSSIIGANERPKPVLDGLNFRVHSELTGLHAVKRREIWRRKETLLVNRVRRSRSRNLRVSDSLRLVN